MKKLFFIFLLIGSSCALWSQEDNGNILLPKNQKNQNPFGGFTFGGNIGASFGDNVWGVSLSPRIGYKLTDDLELAFSVNYNWQKTSYSQYNFLGLGPAVNYYFFRSAYVHASYQHYFIKQKFDRQESYRTEEDALYLGGGYMQPLGGNAYLQMGFSYNVLYKKDKSIFSSGFSPSVGIVIGL